MSSLQYWMRQATKHYKQNEQLRAQLATVTAEREALKAKVDALMLEYCPGEMTQEQVDNWAERQQPAPREST